MATEDAGEAFWRFSLAVYAVPGVEEACLFLQDRRGLDVNLLLVCLWAGTAHGTALRPQDLDRLESALAPWSRDVVQPLRQVRRRLKHGPSPAPSPETAALRRSVQASELAAERAAQGMLASLLPQPATDAPNPDAPVANLALLIPPNDEDGWSRCQKLLTAAAAVGKGSAAA